MKKFHFFYLFILTLILPGLFPGVSAAALTDDQQAQIQTAVDSGDPEVIETTIKGIIKTAIIDGEDPAAIAQEATAMAVTAAAGPPACELFPLYSSRWL